MRSFVAAVAWWAAALFLFRAYPAPITWSPAVDTTGKAQLVEGEILFAFSGGSGATVTDGGPLGAMDVTFVGGDYQDLAFTPAPGSRSLSSVSGGSPSTGDLNFDAVAGSLTDSESGITSGTQTLSGLTVGETYQLQVFYNDQRSGLTGRVMRYGDGEGNTVDLEAGGSGWGQHAVGSFTADATTQSITHNALGFGNVHLNALLLVKPGDPDVPPVPTGLTALGRDERVILDWDPVGGFGFDRYEVGRSAVSGGPYTVIASPTTSGYTDTGLVNGQSYFYAVRAVNVNDEASSYGEEREGIPDPVPVPPNFVFIITDDQDTYSVGAYRRHEASENKGDGTPYDIQTPHIDRIAEQGMLFHQARIMGANAPAVCQPSRTSIMTGKSIWRNTQGVTAAVTLPGIFNRGVRSDAVDLPYATYRTCKEGNSYPTANNEFTVVADATKRGNTDGEGSEWHGDRALDFLDHWRANHQPAGKPFLLYLGFSHPHDTRNARPDLAARYGAVNTNNPGGIDLNPDAPPLPLNHLPVDAPTGIPANFPFHPFDNGHLNVRDEVSADGIGKYRTEAVVRNEIGRNFAAIDWIDTQVGRVLDQLEDPDGDGDTADSLLENTYVIFTSDHGIAIGRHGLQGKQNLYGHTWRVPYIVMGPGIEPGSRSQALIYLHDSFATLCDLAGIDPPATWAPPVDSSSFRSVLEGATSTHREVLTGLYAGGDLPGIRAVTDGRFKLIATEANGGATRVTQLFDLESNPFELLPEHGEPNLADRIAYAGIRRDLERHLAEQRIHSGDPHVMAGDRMLWRFEQSFADRLPFARDGQGVGDSGGPAFSSDTPHAEDLVLGEDNQWSLELDGEGQHVEVADDARLDFGSDSYILEAWVKLDRLPSGPTVADRNPVLHKPGDYLFLATLGDLGGATGYNRLGIKLGSTVVMSSLAIPDTAWHHVAVIVDPRADEVRFVLDDVVDPVSTPAQGTTGNAALQIGADGQGSFEGRLDEVGVVRGTVEPERLQPLGRAPEPSPFQVEAEPLSDGHTLRLRFESDDRLLYSIQQKQSLLDAQWTTVRDRLGGEPDASFTVLETHVPHEKGFFRLESRRPR
ncbi:MAG: sulfatase-like hydrolase/transferase [Kiritimatiellia bacterium]